jgi:hypothetical protein
MSIHSAGIIVESVGLNQLLSGNGRENGRRGDREKKSVGARKFEILLS